MLRAAPDGCGVRQMRFRGAYGDIKGIRLELGSHRDGAADIRLPDNLIWIQAKRFPNHEVHEGHEEEKICNEEFPLLVIAGFSPFGETLGNLHNYSC